MSGHCAGGRRFATAGIVMPRRGTYSRRAPPFLSPVALSQYRLG